MMVAILTAWTVAAVLFALAFGRAAAYQPVEAVLFSDVTSGSDMPRGLVPRILACLRRSEVPSCGVELLEGGTCARADGHAGPCCSGIDCDEHGHGR